MEPFKRRTYCSLRQIFSDLHTVLRRRKEMGPLMRGETLPKAFRERLMLAVTEVNECRYCAYYHAKQALVEGLSEAEIEALTQGDFSGSPPHERAGLLYAQHWAEADGNPDPAARKRLQELYDPATVGAIELALCVIRIGNLMGNTWDAVLYRLSAGRWGAATAT